MRTCGFKSRLAHQKEKTSNGMSFLFLFTGLEHNKCNSPAFYTTGTTHVVKVFSEEVLQFSQEILDYLTGSMVCDTIKLLFTVTFPFERSTYSCV